MLTVQAPQLNFNSEGVPCSEHFQDPYFSLQDALQESQYVFLGANNVVERWSDENFVIAELGFGFGVNFTITSQAWIEQKSLNSHLHFISVEKFPLSKANLEQCYRQLGINSPFTEALIRQYPPCVQGTHRIEFNEYNLSLTLIFGDALHELERSDFLANVWYLDGFSPNKNPDLWSLEIARQIHRLTQEDGTFSTYSAASLVNRHFSEAGFTISKRPGFGKKREMLLGQKPSRTETSSFPLKEKSWLKNHSKTYSQKSAIVIGAGMAGVCISAALAKRKWNVTMIEKNESLASEGSGNANAILMPRLSVDHDLQSQLTLLGFLYSNRLFSKLASQYSDFHWQQCGAIQIPRDQAQWERMQQIVSQKNIPDELLKSVSQQQASDISSCKVAKSGWHIPLAGHVTPQQLCTTLVSKYSDQINVITNREIHSIEKKDSQWIAYDHSKDEIHSAEIIIIANAHMTHQFSQTEWCQLNPKRGQVTYVSQEQCNIQPSTVICADAYVTPAVDSHIVIGATFITNDSNTDIRQSEHDDNIAKLQTMIPDFTTDDSSMLDGRAGIRAVSSDRMPIVGPVANKELFDTTYQFAALGSTRETYPIPTYHDGLYLASGFGSRGLSWIPLCTEALACEINNEPSPLNKALLNSIHPNRILMKALIKRMQNTS